MTPKGAGPWKSRPVTVGCGYCLGCRAKQARDWMIRCLHERVFHDAAWFLTLTYHDGSLPANGSLSARHLQIFFKALRRRVPQRIRYFACGEYGERTKRPHYHALLFGPQFLDLVPSPDLGQFPAWRSEVVASAWPHGIHELGSVTQQSTAYVCGYVQKKLREKDVREHPFYLDNFTGEVLREHEFTRVSLRPAIGRVWLHKYWRDVYPRDFVPIGGREFRPPRYYDKWMDDEHTPTRITLLVDGVSREVELKCEDCKEHQEVMAEVREKRWDELEVCDRDQLESKEKDHKSRLDLFERRIAV